MLLNLKNIHLNFGNDVLFDAVDLSVDAGERLCLVGRNGTGKSTLMRLLTGEQQPDSGEILRAPSLRVALLPQDVPRGTAGGVFDIVAEGLGEAGRLLAEYHHLLQTAPDDLDRLGRVQGKLEAADGWSLDSQVAEVLTRLELDGEADFDSLSGGLKRRVLLAQALVAKPDLLLLDEPTNHLDIDSITWLESFLLSWNGSLLFITHDRAFLRRLATRIIELDRGYLTSWPGNYDDYLRHKAEALHAESQADARFRKKLAQEEAWIRKGIEARRTRNEGRVRALLELREQDRARRKVPGQAQLVLQEAERSGKLVAEAKNIAYAYADQSLIRNFSTLVLRGDKIGVIGPNGVGKTTLLKLLLAQLPPDSGQVRIGTRLQVAYFDQMRAQLDEDRPVFENIGDGKEYLEPEGPGGRQVHVMGYLQDFLFTPQRARSPVRVLSGGERARLLLARLFSRPANLLVLDEPTNDLDVETLDLLEERLLAFQGTVLLVSHDREFLDRVVNRCLVFEGEGRISDSVGGYRDWLRQRTAADAPQTTSPVVTRSKISSSGSASRSVSQPRFGSKQQRELDALPGKIEELEMEQSELAAQLSDPSLYSEQPEAAQVVQQRLGEIERTLQAHYARWETLEALRAGENG